MARERKFSSLLLVVSMTAAGLLIGIVLLLFITRPDFSTLLAQTRPAATTTAAAPQSAPQASAQDDDTPTEEQLRAALPGMIDNLAGHPDDPQLPKGILGASDEVLRATEPREIADLLEIGVAFAKENPGTPRFLFALGRAALAHGYDRLGMELLGLAREYGSGAASAYLGLAAAEDGDNDRAIAYLNEAGRRSFQSKSVKAALASLAGSPSPTKATPGGYSASKFNRPDIIQALYNKDVQALKRLGLDSAIYIATLHNTLWADNILFVTQSPELLLELDATIATRISMQVMSSGAAVGQAADVTLGSVMKWFEATAQARRQGLSITEEVARSNAALAAAPARLEILRLQAVQDARRLALLYDGAPNDFRRVYAGIKAFAE